MKLEGYPLLEGKHPETSAVRNILAYQGMVAPHTSDPFTEEMLLGIGGGLGAGYFVISYGDVPGMAIGTRHLWYDSPKFVTGLCDRLGVKTIVEETTSPKLAARILKESLAEGSPAITYLDLACLPYTTLPPEFRKGGYHVAVVYGYDEERNEVTLGDLSRHAYTIAASELEEARKSISSYKNRMVLLQVPLKRVDLEKAITAGIRACCDGLLHARIQNFSLEAIRKWGRLVGDAKGKEGWANVFKPGAALYRGLTWTYRFIQLGGTGGGGMRGMYADFLEEAGAALYRKELTDVAAQYRECAELWSGIAETALPDSVEPLKAARLLLDRRHRRLREAGPAAVSDLREMTLRLAEIETEVKQSFPLNAKEIQDLLADLSRKILHLYEKESEALSALQAFVAN